MNDLFNGDFVSPTPNNLILSPVYQSMPMNIYHRDEVQEVVVTEQRNDCFDCGTPPILSIVLIIFILCIFVPVMVMTLGD